MPNKLIGCLHLLVIFHIVPHLYAQAKIDAEHDSISINPDVFPIRRGNVLTLATAAAIVRSNPTSASGSARFSLRRLGAWVGVNFVFVRR